MSLLPSATHGDSRIRELLLIIIYADCLLFLPMQVQRLFKRSTPRDLQLIAWSLARLQYRPQAAWVQGFVRRLVRLAACPAGSPEQEGAALRPQHVAVCFWALAKLQVGCGPG